MNVSSANLFLLLARLLKRTGLSPEVLPSDMEKWQNFIERINKTFLDTEQERYLLERSMEISSREMRDLNDHLEKTRSSMVALARQAGMSEIATGVLHNIGNVLNSINLSTALIDEQIKNCQIQKIEKISQLISENSVRPEYFLSDPKGKLIPDYLKELAKTLKNNFNNVNKEIMSLNKNLEHIKNIVAMQKDISGIAGVTEKLYLPEIIDLSLRMAINAEKSGITIIKKYSYSGFVYIDKAKLLQILINLIRNAKEAMLERHDAQKHTMTFYTEKIKDFIQIRIQDNGIGIPEENLTKIFSMGFTTKKEGHGFGLHSSALTAKELGGSLKAEIPDEQGAMFILSFPIPKEKDEGDSNDQLN